MVLRALEASFVCVIAAGLGCDDGRTPAQAADGAVAVLDMAPSPAADAAVADGPGRPPEADADAGAARATMDAGKAADGDDAGRAGGSFLTMQEAIASYAGWTRLQAEPQAISAQIFGLCRLPSRAETAFTESVHGQYLALLDWANEPAVRGLSDGGVPEFPRGAAIVKQKLMGAGASAKLVALGIMIKRADGFDPAHGDWEFGYWDEGGGLSAGSEGAQACGGCHAGAKTDFVFADQSWRLEP